MDDCTRSASYPTLSMPYGSDLAISFCDGQTVTSRFSLHRCRCAAETTSSLDSPQNLRKINHILRATQTLRCSFLNHVLLKNYSLQRVLEWWPPSKYRCPRFFLRQPTAPLHCTSQHPLRQPLCCWFFRFVPTTSPALQCPCFNFTFTWTYSTVRPRTHIILQTS